MQNPLGQPNPKVNIKSIYNIKGKKISPHLLVGDYMAKIRQDNRNEITLS